MSRTAPYSLLNNSRFYILTSSLLVSVVLICWTRITITNDQVFSIRTSQLLGFLSIIYLYIALIISPLGAVIGKEKLTQLAFMRRAIGVSACYFAVLHAGISLWGQLGGVSGALHTPAAFMSALLLGVVGLIVLLAMAATSFDVVIKRMSFRRWKWLHRFIYIGGVMILAHVWMIGTHVTLDGVQLALFVPLSLLIGLEAFRSVARIAQKYPELASKDYFYTLVLSIWLIGSGALLLIPQFTGSYHGNHQTHTEIRQ